VVIELLSEKGKRKLEYQGRIYYWYIKKDADDVPKICIISDDKKLQLKHGFDREMIIGPAYIKGLLQRHFTEI